MRGESDGYVVEWRVSSLDRTCEDLVRRDVAHWGESSELRSTDRMAGRSWFNCNKRSAGQFWEVEAEDSHMVQ